ITSKFSNQNRLDIPISSIPTPSIPNVLSSLDSAVLAISSAVTNAANTAANSVGDIAAVALGLLSQLLSAFDNFKPSPANVLDGGKDIIEMNGFTFVFQYKAYFKSSIDRINVNEVESTVRVRNLNIEGIRKEEFDIGFLVILKCTRVRKIAFQIA
ncbi:4035_t:CDS:2, partial [Racocetra persica]